MSLQWYVVHTTPLGEYSARDQLINSGLEVLLPCAQTPNPRPGHQDTPLFPGYLFLRSDLEDGGWEVLRRSSQVVWLVTFGGVVPTVPDEVISGLIRRLETINERGGVRERFRSGDLVQVIWGPVERIGEVVEDSRSPQSRVTVLLDFLGRLVEAKVPSKNLKPVGKHWMKTQGDLRPPRRTRGKNRWIQGFGLRSTSIA